MSPIPPDRTNVETAAPGLAQFRRVTLKDVAAHVRLSVAAVSMALRDHDGVSPETAARVKVMAKRLNYAPDPAMSALAAYRSRLRVYRNFSVIGLVSNWSAQAAWSSLRSARAVISGATERARELGYSLEHLWARVSGASAPRFNAILEARGIRGLILAPFEAPDATFELNWANYSVVTIERPTRYSHFHHVVENHYADLLLCWEKLRERGYQRIGLVVRGDLAHRWSHQWEAAHSFAQTHGPTQFIHVPTLELKGADPVGQIRGWLREYRPEVVINRSEDFFSAADAEGLRVPADLGYVSLNVIDDRPGVSGILQHRDIMGATAIDVLNSLLQRNQRGFQPVSLGTQVDGSWTEGTTLPVRRAPRAGSPRK